MLCHLKVDYRYYDPLFLFFDTLFLNTFMFTFQEYTLLHNLSAVIKLRKINSNIMSQ